jgi:hypothetical protein
MARPRKIGELSSSAGMATTSFDLSATLTCLVAALGLKGQQTMPDFVLGADPPVIYPPVGRCIYCDSHSSVGLGDEHVIPYSLNGTMILRKASCARCAGVTSRQELIVARGVFHQVRTTSSMRTRRKLPTEFPLILTFPDRREEIAMVPEDIYPANLVLPKFVPPALLSGQPSNGNFRFTYVRWVRASEAHDEFVRSRGASGSEVKIILQPQQFSRVLAKMAHSFAVAELGLDGFCPILLDLIHGRNVEVAPELVGCEIEIPPAASGRLHEIGFVSHPEYVVVRIRLFASSAVDAKGTPVYLVVAGTRPDRVPHTSGV